MYERQQIVFEPEKLEANGFGIISRQQVSQFTGGMISPKTLANADYRGTGPKRRIIHCRKVSYYLKDLCDWVRDNSYVLSRTDSNITDHSAGDSMEVHK